MTPLPEGAAAKAFQLQQSAEQSARAADTAEAGIKELLVAQTKLERERDTLAERRQSDEAASEPLNGVLAKLRSVEAEIETLTEVRRRQAERAENDQAVLRSLRKWLMTVPSHAEVVMAAPVKPSRHKDTAKAITQVRRQLEEVKSKRREIAQAPEPIGDTKAKAREYVRQLAESAMARVELDARRISLRFETDAGRDFRLLQILAWFDPDLMLTRIEEELDKVAPSDAKAISRPDKQRRFAELDQAELDLERKDEQLVLEAIASGQHTLRREQANPLAVLGVEIRPMARQQQAA